MPAATSLEDIYHNALLSDESLLTGCCNSLSSSYSPSSTLSSYHSSGIGDSNSSATGGGSGAKLCLNEDCEDYIFQKLLQLATTRTSNSNTINCDVLNYNDDSSESRLRHSKLINRNHRGQQRATITEGEEQHYLRAQNQRTMHSKSQRGRLVGNKASSKQTTSKRQPLNIFFYHDDDLSTSSAPDSFPEVSSCAASQQPSQQAAGAYLTIEELKSALNSCWLCGCNWAQDHLSLDCQECGGYSLTRPCLKCEGKCQQLWKRNINATHDHHKALWMGECQFEAQSRASASSAFESLKLSDSAAVQPASSVCSSAPTSSSSDSDGDDDEDQTGEEKASQRRPQLKASQRAARFRDASEFS